MNLRRQRRIQATFSLASVADIIFLLLIFFLLTSPIVAPTAIRVLLPQATSTTHLPRTHSLTITAEGQFFLDGRQVLLDQLPYRLASIRGEDTNAVVAIYADREAKVQLLVSALDAGRQAGVRMIMATSYQR